MARVLEVLVSILLFLGVAALCVSVGTNNWSRLDASTGIVTTSGLFRFCTDSSLTDKECTHLWNDIKLIPDEMLTIICLMLISILFHFISTLVGCCSCACRKPMTLVVALLVFISVSASAVGLGLYTHYYRAGADLHYSYYLGWAGTGFNLLGVVFLLAILMR